MTNIPAELIEQVERGNVLLFLGEGILGAADNRRLLDQLTNELVAPDELEKQGHETFPVVAQAFEDEKGRHALVQFIRKRIDESGYTEPQENHRLIAELTSCRVLVTTCIDRRLERAFEQAGRLLNVITTNVDVAFEEGTYSQLYKLRGSADRPTTLILTEDDHERFFEDQVVISVVLQSYLARKTILFVGYDLSDPAFKRLYRKITGSLDGFAPQAYAADVVLAATTVRWSRRNRVQLLEMDAATILQSLLDQLGLRSNLTLAPSVPASSRRTHSLPERPYKLLDYYESDDAGIFFGRYQETETLTALIHAHRLVLLYGNSGVGKTSLLLAGVLPRIEDADPPYIGLYVRALENPSEVIRRLLLRRLGTVALPTTGALLDLIDAANKAMRRPLIIILDQFEEFFIRLNPQDRAAFIADLGALYDARDVPVRLVLSLREDWLASVGEIEQRIPGVFRNRMRLLPMSREQALEAIEKPVGPLGVQYEPQLIERLLDDLASGDGTIVMPPQLQLVCSTLFGALQPADQVITLELYNRLGGARGVLQRYLEDELARLDLDERTSARHILQELVTSQGTKAVMKVEDLALALNQPADRLLPVLHKLVDARLLRVVERDEQGQSYELAHEYLIGEIAGGVEVKQRKESEELIRQEIDTWRRLGTLMGSDKLTLVDRVKDTIRIGREGEELLLRSALSAQSESSVYWLTRLDDDSLRESIIQDYVAHSSPDIRRWTLQALSTCDAPIIRQILATQAVCEPVSSLRQAAAAALVRHSTPEEAVQAVLGLSAASEDRIVEALANISDAAQDIDLGASRTRIRVWSFLLKRRLQQGRLTLTYRGLSGGFGSGITGAIFGAVLTYLGDWQQIASVFDASSQLGAVSYMFILCGILGLAQGTGAALGLTLPDLAARPSRWYLRMLCGLVASGVFLGITLAIRNVSRIVRQRE